MRLDKLVRTKDLFKDVPPHLKELFDSCEYPWDILKKLEKHLASLLENGMDGYEKIKDGVLVGKGVSMHESAVVEPPCVIGHNCEIRPGAYIRGRVIVCDGCVVGNSTELKNCIMLQGAQAPHYNYIGDSILGVKSHTGAGVICSNLKSDGKNVRVRADVEYETGLRKLGAIIGDGADVGCGAVLNPGTVIGRMTRVYPLTALRGVYPADSIVKSSQTVVKMK